MDNCCQRIHTLDLRHNNIGRAGIEKLMLAFKGEEVGRNITYLNLSYNDLPGSAMRVFCDVVKGGGVPSLTKLDLKANRLQDHGACMLASLLLHKGFPNLQVLELQSNEIKDHGILAFYRVFEDRPGICPNIKSINLRRNLVSVKGYREMHRCPSFLYV